jgi:hypothetical protein
MEKLCYDELVLIMISMREQHTNEMKIVEEKYNALSDFCKKRIGCRMLESGTCSCCGEFTHTMCDVREDEGGCVCENFVRCSGCNKVICHDCIDNKDFCIKEYIDNPNPNKFWCKKCHDFKQKIAELK